MSETLWSKIVKATGGKPETVPGFAAQVMLLPVGMKLFDRPSYWLIGEYQHLTDPATALRTSAELQKFVTKKGVRFGLRSTDYPPNSSLRQKSFRKALAGFGLSKGSVADRVRDLSKPIDDPPGPIGNRRNDRQPEVWSYWQTQTAHAHHIVEFNNLRTLGVSQKGKPGELDHAQLPCVWLSAEFHKCYVSPVLNRLHGKSEADLKQEMPKAYRHLYETRCPPLAALWPVSRVILRAAGFTI